MFAIVEAYRTGLLKPKNWMPNLMAGLVVGVIALPLAMAFAIASGVKPEQGLYTAIIAAIVVAIFGGSQVQIAGPTGAFVVILAQVTAQYGVSGLQVATLMAGLILLFMGIAKLGNIIKFIPDPVIVGFTSGIGFIIFVGEWKDFFGLSVHLPLGSPFYQKIILLFKAFPELSLPTLGLASLSLLLTLIVPKYLKRIPGPLIAMVVATTLQAIFHFKGVATVGSAFGGIPRTLPEFHWPLVSIKQTFDLIGPAFTIALLGAIESLLSAAAADGMTGSRHHSNQELIGQGLANMITPLFGGFAATGAIARTATNVRNGGNSPLAAIIHSGVLVLVILLLAPFAAYIPLCTLAAILFVVAYHMSDIPHFIYIFRKAPRYDVYVLLVTFLLTVFTDLVVAVNVGVILAMLFFIRRMHQSTGIEQQTVSQLQSEVDSTAQLHLPKHVLIYTIHGPLFFGVAEKIEHALMATHTEPKIIIFRLKEVPFIDITGLQTFKELIEHYHKKGIAIYLCETNARVMRKLANVGILKWICEAHIWDTLENVLKKLELLKVAPGKDN